MHRFAAVLLTVLIALPWLLPCGVLINWRLERERIRKELCVQREMADSMRTCHGECVLMKRLKQAEDTERNARPPLVQWRMEPAVPQADERWNMVPPAAGDMQYSHPLVLLAAGHVRRAEPVPWC